MCEKYVLINCEIVLVCCLSCPHCYHNNALSFSHSVFYDKFSMRYTSQVEKNKKRKNSKIRICHILIADSFILPFAAHMPRIEDSLFLPRKIRLIQWSQRERKIIIILSEHYARRRFIVGTILYVLIRP